MRLIMVVREPGVEHSKELSEPTISHPYLVNLFLVGAIAIALTVWFNYYTEWFPVLASLLSLGGVFSGLAVILKMISEERAKQMTAQISGWIFDGLGTRKVTFGI